MIFDFIFDCIDTFGSFIEIVTDHFIWLLVFIGICTFLYGTPEANTQSNEVTPKIVECSNCNAEIVVSLD